MTNTHTTPAHDTVLYDGQCRFCRSQIGILKRLDWWHRLQFTSLHDPSVAADFPEIPLARLHEEMVVVDRTGRARGGAEALRYLSRRLPPQLVGQRSDDSWHTPCGASACAGQRW